MQKIHKKSMLLATLLFSCHFNAPATIAAHVFRTCAAYVLGKEALSSYTYVESQKIELGKTVAEMNQPLLNKVCKATSSAASSILEHGQAVNSEVLNDFSKACNGFKILTTTFPCYLERISHACFMKYCNWQDPVGRKNCDNLPAQSLNEAKNLGTINIISSAVFYAAIIGGTYMAYKKGYFKKFKDYVTKQNDETDDSENQA